MSLSKLPIKALEAFEATARTGSLARAAREVNLSISAVSHHLGRLEASLGTALLDRSHRPMRLTAAGAEALQRIEEGLRHIRSAGRPASEPSLAASARPLRVGLPGGGEGPLGPALGADLLGATPGRRLVLRAEPGHRAARLVRLRRLDAAVAQDPPRPPAGLSRRPLLLQPLVLAVPRDCDLRAERLLAGVPGLPRLRLDPRRPMGRGIDAQLGALGASRGGSHAVDDVGAVMEAVARGGGWTAAPAGACVGPALARGEVTLRPLPPECRLRPLSLYGRRVDGRAPDDLLDTLLARAHRVVARDVARPLAERFPWLLGALTPGEGA